MKAIHAADLYCGAGGTSSGLVAACRERGVDLELLAVNHWEIAIETHSLNHPYAKHICESIDNVDPRKVVPRGHLHVLIASPECTHHSVARGGRPISDQFRVSAWHILRWAEALRVDSILIENVREFQNWGPLGVTGRPIQRLKGETYRAFLNALRSLNYSVEDRILNAAYFGDATTRERLFIVARRGRKEIHWPEPTHFPDEQLYEAEKWRAAREIIDWNLAGESIFARKRPLKEKTIARIAAGLRKFGGANAEPFLLMLYGTSGVRSVDRPLPTITAKGNHIGLCEPFLLGQQSQGSPRSVKNPVPTIATKGAIALVEPFIVPFFGERKGQPPRTHSVHEPLPTVTSHGAGGLVEPFLVKVNHGDDDHSDSDRCYSSDRPLPTLTTKNGLTLVEPYLLKYYGTAVGQRVSQPLDTITTKDRFGLVVPESDGLQLDIRFRMLQPHELAAAMSFPEGYRFAGGKGEQTKQIGNAVPVRMATALCRSLLDYVVRSAQSSRGKP